MTGDEFLNKCLHKMCLVDTVHNIMMRVAHIPCKHNNISDVLSYGQLVHKSETVW